MTARDDSGAAPRATATRERWLGIVCAITVVGLATAAGLGRHHVRADDSRPVPGPVLGAWYSGFQHDAQRLDTYRIQAERQLDALAVQLSTMQAQIVHLDSLARRLVERAGLEDQALDFSREPALGGPEETPFDAADPAGSYSMYLPAAADRVSRQLDDQWRQLSVLEDLLEWRELSAAVHPEGRPVGSGYVSSGFGARIDPFTGRTAAHHGIDFAARRGTPVVAVAAGIVTWSGPRAGYGRMVEIDHGNEHVTRYAHNSQNLVAVGDVVTRGQTIAKLGSTGRATGPNLHFEVLQSGRAVNPLPYIE